MTELARPCNAGINRPNPVLASTVDGIVKFNLQPGMYSLDMPFSLGVLHGKGFDVNSDKTDGRYNRITGVNDAYVTVKPYDSNRRGFNAVVLRRV